MTDVGEQVVHNIQNTDNNGVWQVFVDPSRGFLGDIYHTLVLIGVYGGVIMLLVGFMMYMASGSGPSKAFAKKKIGVTLIGIALIFLATSIIAIIFRAAADTF